MLHMCFLSIRNVFPQRDPQKCAGGLRNKCALAALCLILCCYSDQCKLNPAVIYGNAVMGLPANIDFYRHELFFVLSNMLVVSTVRFRDTKLISTVSTRCLC